MQVSEISFCGRIAYNIKTDETKTKILEELQQLYKCKIIQRHYDKYSQSIHLSKLNTNPHMVCVRTNGNPYLLYMTRLNFVNQCVFIDKKVQSGYFLPRVLLSKFHFDDELFDGTLFDGEMVKDNSGHWIYLIHDIIACKGHYFENVNLIKRINAVYDCLNNNYVYDDTDVCRFQVKRYFSYTDVPTLLQDFIPNLNYTCRGIYFKPLFLKFKDILFNFDDSLVQKVSRIKYKDVGNFLVKKSDVTACDRKLNHIDSFKSDVSVSSSSFSSGKTIVHADVFKDTHKACEDNVFWVSKTSQPDIYELCKVSDNSSYGTACIPSLKVSKFMRSLFADKNVIDKIKMICEKSDKFPGKFVPIKKQEH